MVYPTHGAGLAVLDRDRVDARGRRSATSGATTRSSRRWRSRRSPGRCSPASRPFPRYFARMRPINQAGPPLLGGVVPEIAPLSGDGGRARRSRRGALVVDARPPARPRRGPHPGLAVDPGRVVVRDVARLGGRPGPAGRAARRAIPPTSTTWPARRCGSGSTTVAGYIDGGFEAWRRAGRPVEAGGRADVDELGRAGSAGGPRRRSSSTSASRPSTRPATSRAALHIGAGDAAGRCSTDLPRDRPIATICASGYRSSVAASLLRAAGFERRGGRRRRRPGLGGAWLPGRLRRRTRPDGRSTRTAPRTAHTHGSRPHLSGTGRLLRASADVDPEEPERRDPEQHRVEDDHQPDRRPGEHVPDPAVAWSPISRSVVDQQDHEDQHDRQQQALQVLRGR